MSYLLTTCQPGAEKALKEEIGKSHPQFRLAYSRPGFVTFKTDPVSLEPGFELKSIFALSYSVSLGKTKASSLLEKCKSVLETAASQGSEIIFLFERDGKAFASNQPNLFLREVEDYLNKQIESLTIKKKPRIFSAPTALTSENIANGTKVLEVILVEAEEWWLGHYSFQAHHRFYPKPVSGGRPMLSLSDKYIPSRAYFKTAEALVLGKIVLRVGDRALDLGSSPGGSSLYLIENGVEVLGVDPGEMDEVLQQSTLFKQLKMKAEQITESVLGGKIHWIFSDMNIPAEQVLTVIKKYLKFPLIAENLRGGAVNIKLQSLDQSKSVQQFVSSLLALGFSKVGYRHLYNNATEVAVWFEK